MLFIGNSLTYSNDLPAMIAALAETHKQKRLRYQMIAFPDFGLEDHWNQGDALKALGKNKWDYVVLQQGPSGLPESRAMLLEYTRRFAEKIRAAGATPALYQVWPSRVRNNDFPRVLESYRLAAETVGGILLPVGAAWQAAWKDDPEFPLYAADQFHPSVLGSYLAAAVIYQKLFGSVPADLPIKLRLPSKHLPQIEITKAQTTLLGKVVVEVSK